MVVMAAVAEAVGQAVGTGAAKGMVKLARVEVCSVVKQVIVQLKNHKYHLQIRFQSSPCRCR